MHGLHSCSSWTNTPCIGTTRDSWLKNLLLHTPAKTSLHSPVNVCKCPSRIQDGVDARDSSPKGSPALSLVVSRLAGRLTAPQRRVARIRLIVVYLNDCRSLSIATEVWFSCELVGFSLSCWGHRHKFYKEFVLLCSMVIVLLRWYFFSHFRGINETSN